MTLAIDALLDTAPLDAEAIDAFLGAHRFPITEGTTTTFVYRGEADEVNLQHWVFGLESSQAFERVAETDLWYLVIELPERSRVEYKFDVQRNGSNQWIRDPLNPFLAHDPYGANSVCQGHGYELPDWTLPDPEAREGVVETIEIASRAFDERRVIRVYLPPRLRRVRKYPLLIAHDGSDYVRYAKLRTVLDNLVYREEIPPLIVALTDSADRLTEYVDDPRHAAFIAEEVLPTVQSKWPTRSEPAQIGLMGASLGAVASLSTAWRYPNRFGRLLLQSGSFAFSDIGERHRRGPTFDPIVKFMNRFRGEHGNPTERLFVSCGVYESLIYENRSLIPLLQDTDMDVRYVEARDGHNWENWRDRLREGLSWLFPGPLWMVYE